MNFTRMSFDKNWNNHADFPTHESQEAKVRADMQYLYDSIKDQFNNFLENELFAANIPYNPTAGIQAENVQAAIDAVHAEIVDIVDLSVADGSITDAKLKQDSTGETSAVVENAIRNGAVSTNKIQDGAVMRAKISNGAIDESKLADNSVYNRHIHADAVNTTQLVNGAVTTDKIYLGAVTDEKLASNSVITAKIKDGNVTNAKLATDAVTTAKIKDGNVEWAKLSQGTKDLINGKAPTAHASSATTYGVGDGSNYGHLKLSSQINLVSGIDGGIAATPYAVKVAYDLASGKAPTSHASSETTYGVGNGSNYGHLKLSNATDSSSNIAGGIAATPLAVKTAYDLAAGKAPTAHASSATTYGVGTDANYGHLKLSSSTSSTSTTSGGVAATPAAVKAAYDLAAGKAPTAHASTATTYGIGTGSNYGHVKLSDSTSSTSAASAGIAASPAAVKAAYDLANGKAAASHTSVVAADTTYGHAKISKGTVTLTKNAKSWASVSLSGATCNSSSLIVCAPAPASYAQWVDNRVRCTAQGTNVLTFAADTNITADVTVNVLVIKV